MAGEMIPSSEPTAKNGYAWTFPGELSADQRERVAQLEEYYGEQIDWYIPGAMAPPIYCPELEETLPSSLLDGEFAEKVLRGEI